MITNLYIKGFKRVQEASLPLDKISVLVGGNNSGKSCFLQGIHFAVALSQSQKIAGSQQFPPDKLRYCPTDDFLNLHHGARLTEGTRIVFKFERTRNNTTESADIVLTRGRNAVVKAICSGDSFLREISDPKGFFSIYVPGLAGITIREEYRSDLVVNNGIARGDANLYLRNVLLRIHEHNDKKTRFQDLLKAVFPGHVVHTRFDIANDLWISSDVELPDRRRRPLDMLGTGLLQAVQLIAYVTNYAPRLLLLDEPDSHLHPNNQRLLARTLHLIAQESDTQIILATHSRHLLDALSDLSDSKLFWTKDGKCEIQENWSDIAVLMDLGALDRGEYLLSGTYRYVVWTEDSDERFLRALMSHNGISNEDTLFFSYQCSSKADAAGLMARFIERVRPGVRVIIHRDRDFMTDEEVARMKRKFGLESFSNARIFVTRYPDIESYFLQPAHVASVLGMSEADAKVIVETLIRENNIQFTLKFREKREEIKRTLYRNDPDRCPSIGSLISGSQIPVECAHGKSLFRLLGPILQDQGRNAGDILLDSDALFDQDIVALRVDNS